MKKIINLVNNTNIKKSRDRDDIDVCLVNKLILVWPTRWTWAVGDGLIVSESVCPKTCRHIDRRMMNG